MSYSTGLEIMNINELKRQCRKCYNLLELNNFDKATPDGRRHRTECRSCRKKINAALYLKRKERKKLAAQLVPILMQS